MARAAVKQRRIDELLQLLNAVGDHRAGYTQLLCRLGEVVGFGNSNKGFESE